MKTCFVLLLALALPVLGRTEEAAAAFAAGDFKRSAELQEVALTRRAPSAEGYYNLGLAYQRAGDSLAAALNYARALHLDPGLQPARTAITELAAGRTPSPLPRTWRDDVRTLVHPEWLLVAGVVLVWAGLFGVFMLRGGPRVLGVAILAVGAVGAALGALTDPRLSGTKPAIVTARDGAELLTAPATNSTLVVALPAGSPVAVVSPRGSWSYVDVGGGARGWVQTEQLSPVIPGESL